MISDSAYSRQETGLDFRIKLSINIDAMSNALGRIWRNTVLSESKITCSCWLSKWK